MVEAFAAVQIFLKQKLWKIIVGEKQMSAFHKNKILIIKSCSTFKGKSKIGKHIFTSVLFHKAKLLFILLS
jgi:hypothetical protein